MLLPFKTVFTLLPPPDHPAKAAVLMKVINSSNCTSAFSFGK
jgi:hypothetical protein